MNPEPAKFKDLLVVILAAGEGTRMKSKLPKVLHPLAGMPMIRYVLDTTLAIGCPRILMVVGHQSDKVRQELKDYPIEFVLQPEQLGTGDAVKRTKEHLKDFEGNLLILNGDTPLISRETLASLVHKHAEYPVTMLTTMLDNPHGYGRIIRDTYGDVRGIVEEKDASPTQKTVKEICSGIYCFKSNFLFETLEEITPNNVQQEYYLTDVIGIFRKKGVPIHTHSATDPIEVLGINDRIQLAEANRLIRQRVLTEWMQNGVTIIDPQTTYIDRRVTIGRDTTIEPHTIIEGECSIGEDCHIGPFSTIEQSRLGQGVRVMGYCVISQSQIRDQAVIGPFARIRPESVIETGARIGNFVEIKKSTIGQGSKVNHLTYLGDATVGKGVNIGAGTITCNYDGQKKNPTIIEDGVFLGSGTQLVAPVKVGDHSYVGAGSTITQDVPPYSLALSRAREIQKSQWVKRKKKNKPS
jgi:bifunctional UDP-N-acetylglucosamine pyrophosphorylase/glucosamine-1-phosphate N-acetyltransferase